MKPETVAAGLHLLQASSMHVEEITSLEALEALRAEWHALWERCPAATPLESPDWLLAWCRHLFAGGELLLIALRSRGRLEGLAPLFIHGHRLRQVSWIGAGVTDYLGPLLAPEIAEAGAAALLEHLVRHGSRWDLCDFDEMRAGSPLVGAQLPRGLARVRLNASICPALALPESHDALAARLAPKFRKQLRYQRARLERMGELRLERADASSLAAFQEHWVRLHTVRWQRHGQSGMLATEAVRAFHRRVMCAFLRRGWLRLYALTQNGEPAAIFYGFAARGRAYYYLGGFDPALARHSPGAVLLDAVIREFIAEGLHELDFLRNQESYKYAWGTRDAASQRLLLWQWPDCELLHDPGRTQAADVLRTPA